MMVLRSAPPSPFGRKVKIAAHMLGLADQIKSVTTDTTNPQDPLRQNNPLGKIPCLVLADGTNVYDSRVIVEYLDHLGGGGKIIPAAFPARLDALTRQALADGLMDAALVIIYEGRWRAVAMHDAKWLAYQHEKIARTLDALAAQTHAGALDIGDIAKACALGYLDLRFGGKWRQTHPSLMAWLDGFAAQVPAFELTRVNPA